MQEIIVYRNPAEAYFWGMLMDGSLFPIIAGVCMFFTVFLVIQIQLLERFFRSLTRRSNYPTYAALLIAAIAGVYTVKYMAI